MEEPDSFRWGAEGCSPPVLADEVQRKGSAHTPQSSTVALGTWFVKHRARNSAMGGTHMDALHIWEVAPAQR